MSIVKNVLLSCLIAGAASLSHAEVVNFNDVPAGTTGDFKSGGFDFKLTGAYAVTIDHQSCGPSCPVNGTMLVLAPYGSFNGKTGALTMSRSGGGTFALAGFEGTGSFNTNEWSMPNYIPNQIDVVGYVLGGGTVTQSFAIDKSVLSGPLPLSAYTFNGNFTNLTSVTFSSSGSDLAIFNGFAIDNINVAAVPEPETYAMMLAGLGMVGFVARRRQRTA